VIEARERLVQLPVGPLQRSVTVDLDRGSDVSGYVGEGHVLAVEAVPLVVKLVQRFYLLLFISLAARMEVLYCLLLLAE
jgi:hypothetical protein